MKKLRYAVVTDGGSVPAWMQAALDSLAAFEQAEQILPPGCHDRASLTGASLDFIVSTISPDPALADCTVHGIWAFHEGDMQRHAAQPPYFWELHDGEPTAGLTLYRLSPEPEMLYQGCVRVIPESLSATADLARAIGRDFLVKGCRNILANVPATPVKMPAPRTLNAAANLRFRARNIRARANAKLDWLFRHEQWGVGIVDQPIEAFLEQNQCPPARWIENRDRERFIADPAGVVETDGYGIFVEDLEQRQYRGKVTYYRYTDEGGFEGPDDVLTESHHLSYPYIIEHEGKIYCAPESAAANEVALYELTAYPSGWKKVATLLENYAALDSTIFQFEGRWWMFSATRVASGAYSLVAFYADDLFGPWQPHALNPLSTDIATSRPGGKPFVADGKLIRPAQDCSRTYGGALALMHVARLTPTEFSEELVRVVSPDPNAPYNEGFHTVFPLGDKTLVDGKRRILIPYVLMKALSSR